MHDSRIITAKPGRIFMHYVKYAYQDSFLYQIIKAFVKNLKPELGIIVIPRN
jgi:hypothetical protein